MRNPEDVPFVLCDLNNPRKWHKKSLRRPWKYRDRFHDAVDDLGLEKAMKRRKNPRGGSKQRRARTKAHQINKWTLRQDESEHGKGKDSGGVWKRSYLRGNFKAHLKNQKKWGKLERGNPMKTRRNCNMTFLSQEQEDRIVSRIASSRNPGTKGRAAAQRWWKGLSSHKRMSVAKSVLGRMNPPSYRGCLLEPVDGGLQIRWPDESQTWVESQQRAQRVIDRFYRKHPRMVRALNPRRKRRNPKRDGTPTRGENRAVKYVEHLRKIMAASENARLEYQRLTGAVAKVGSEIHKPVGPRALKHAAKAHTEAWEEKHEAELTHHTGQLSAPSVAAVVAEHPELRFVTSRISDLDSAIKHFQNEIKELPKDDLSEDEEARLQEEIAKLARQKKILRGKLLEIQPAAATNPRRRSRRLRPGPVAQMKRASARCARALSSLRSALRRL